VGHVGRIGGKFLFFLKLVRLDQGNNAFRPKPPLGIFSVCFLLFLLTTTVKLHFHFVIDIRKKSSVTVEVEIKSSKGSFYWVVPFAD
jgi:hypothetical protein